ncbi:MAG: phosphatase PAP2 family protein [Candidatus Pacearchaeota archaeon]
MNKKRVRLIVSFIAFILALFLSFKFDSEIVGAISKMRGEILNEFFLGITFVSSEIIIFFLLTTLFLWKDRRRRWILPLWATLGISIIVSFFMKVGSHRLRPFQQGIVSTPEILIGASYSTWNFSFPSFQAMMVFAALPIISKEFRNTKIVWAIFAGLVAFSRIYVGMHFLSDVLVGSAIGLLIGVLVVKFEDKKGLGNKAVKKLGIKRKES